MTVKAGQKCTAIRRILVPRAQTSALADALKQRLSGVKVGNPTNPEVKCGPLVNKRQQQGALADLEKLKSESTVMFGGDGFAPVDADPTKSAFVPPTLLLCEQPLKSHLVHEIEIFGPVATLMPYDSTADAIQIARRGSGSLVASIFSDDEEFKRQVTLGIANLHGRIMVVDTSVGTQHTGHGNVMPNCLHGGPGRAGGGEELAGLRALLLYHRRFVVQGPPSLLEAIAASATDSAKLVS